MFDLTLHTEVIEQFFQIDMIGNYIFQFRNPKYCILCRQFSSQAQKLKNSELLLGGKSYPVDGWTNITPRIQEKIGRNLLLQKFNPLWVIKERITKFFHFRFGPVSGSSSPLFSAFDNFSPIVSTEQNFDQLLIPKDHVSRSKTDNYYVNKDTVLRAHTSAHQSELLKSGLDAFLVFGDVYRRDEIDSTHFPVFHQCEGVRLFNNHTLFHGGERAPPSSFDPFPDRKKPKQKFPDPDFELPAEPQLFAQHIRTPEHQEELTMEATKMLEFNLKYTLEELMKHLLGNELQFRWVPQYFPFTHPSWELEVLYQDSWLEVLGCGVMEQQILTHAGCHNMVGWAFGIGLERIAMAVFKIPDIRLFWSDDERFLKQFHICDKNINYKVIFEPFSKFQPLYNDVSFFLPEDREFHQNDLFDIVRNVAGELVESAEQFDEYTCKKTGRKSKAYRLTFRHFEKVLSQDDVREVKSKIDAEITEKLGVTIR